VEGGREAFKMRSPPSVRRISPYSMEQITSTTFSPSGLPIAQPLSQEISSSWSVGDANIHVPSSLGTSSRAFTRKP